jgi:cytochrome d ubiquinol oxidase subunit II
VTTFLASIGLPEIIAGCIMLGLNAYALTGGADFGGGVWDLLATGPRREAQRALIASTIAPIWEANHVWLIAVIVTMFTAFPDAFAILGVVLHIPLTLMLVGIVFRGSAFVFRSYGSRGAVDQRRWGLVFAIASAVTPVLLGVIIGAIAAGDVGAAAARLPGLAGATQPASFNEVFIAAWLAPFPLAVGVLTLALFAYLAAVYLTVAASDPVLREDFRRRALWSAAAVFVAAFGVLAIGVIHAPHVSRALLTTAWSIPLQILTGGAAIVALWALWRRHWRVARIAAAAQVSLILWGWAFAQYPVLIPPTLRIHDAAAPRITLELLLGGLIVGSAILIPSLAYLLHTFEAARVTGDDSSLSERNGNYKA